MNCEHCQTLLLDHLYGLLDRDEAAALDAHLAECPACAAARAETARVQGLFARAAKSTFPNTRFEPPDAAPAQKTEPRTAAVVAPGRPPAADRAGKSWRIAALVPWAVAAAVLVAIPGTVVPVLSIFHRAAEADRAAELAHRAADDAGLATADARRERAALLGGAQVKLAAAEQARVALFDKWLDEQKSVAQAANARKLTIDVQKPATVQPGAPNDFLVVLRDERDGAARRARLVAEVRASDAVLFAQPLDHEKRGHEHSIRLPASVWTKVKPDAELTLVVSEVDEKTQARTPIQEVRLAGPVFTTLLVTDKPVYRPGERLFFRSLTLDRVTLKPPANEQILRYDLIAGANAHPRARQLATATGTTGLVRVAADGSGRVEPVRTADGKPVRGVGCGEFVLPASLADGEYTLVLRELPGAGPVTLPLPVTRTVTVRAGERDTYAKQIGFAGAEAFVSGDTVSAWAELKLQDRPVAGAEVLGVTVQADGVPVYGVEAAPKTDAAGRAHFQFALPPEVLDGDVRVKVTFRAGPDVESVAHRVPVISRRLHVEFFPEGGKHLVAGVPCKVYVRATTPAGQSVDISGVVTDGHQTLATVRTLRDDTERGANRGLASFTFVPQAGALTWLKLDAPNGVYEPILTGVPIKVAEVAGLGGLGAVASRTGFVLPDEPQLDGVVMSVPEAITAPGRPFNVHLYSVGQPRTLVVGAYVRGRLADTQRVHAQAGQLTEVRLMAGSDPRGGVVRITAFEEVAAKNDPDRPDLKPVAERLVFRRPGEVLNLSLAVAPTGPPSAAPAFTPGAPMTCAVSATDEKNNPAAAVLWAAVVNTGVAPGARDRALPTHFLLAGDVKSPDQLEYADFLLTDHPKAREALDLVLGTQGWRRFAEQAALPLAAAGKPAAAFDASSARAASPELARLMVQNGQNVVWAEPVAARDARRVVDTYAPLYEAAVQAVGKARAALDDARGHAQDESDVRRAQAAESAARAAALEQTALTDAAQEPVRRFRSGVWFGVAGFVGLALLCGGVSLARPRTRLPLGFSTVGACGLAVFLFVASGWADEARGDQPKAAALPSDGRDPAKVAPAARGIAQAEIAPAPRPAREPNARDAGVHAKAGFGGLTDVKPNGLAKSYSGAFGAAPALGGPLPAGPGAKGVDSVPFSPPGSRGGRGPEPKFGVTGGGGFTLPLAPPAAPRPAGIGPGLGAGTGWTPARSGAVTANDLAQSAPAGGYSRVPLRRFASEDRAAALKQATAEATWFAHERQLRLTESLESQYAGRAPERAVGQEKMVVQGFNGAQLSPALAEEFALQQMRNTVSPVPPLVVREYANPRPAPEPLDDAEAPDTILWQPVIVLPADGKTVFHFALGSARGGYRVVVAGHTADGRLGEARTVIPVAVPRVSVSSVAAPPAAPKAPAAPAAPKVLTTPGPRP